jgi:DNA recombination protein RmuC
MQYRFPDNVVVDAAIFVGDRIVPVDSKFPLDNFRRSREAPEEGDRRRAQRDFASDVKKHVDAIRSRYIRPESGTFDFALMYVPAEAIYCEIVGEEEQGAALADYALERRVVPVSPRLLYAYLATVAMGMRGLELQRSAQEIQERLSDLGRLWEKVEDPFSKVRVHLANTQKQYDEANKAIVRFGEKLSGIAEVAEEVAVKAETAGKHETIAPVLASLFPPS